MKKIYLLATLGLAGMLTSCYDLNTEPQGSAITEPERAESFESDPSNIAALSNGIYSNYTGFQLVYGENMDFGYPSIMLQLDCRTAGFINSNPTVYAWFFQPTAYMDNTANNAYVSIRWRTPYNTIYTCNQLLATINPETDDNLSKYYRGQAYGNRAFSYWVLAQLFQFNYVGHQNDLCVPIVTEENMETVGTEGAPRATVQEVYDLIISDLTTGIELMTGNPSAVRGSSRSDKRFMDVNVLYALRARTYLCMGEYAKAAADAQTVISAGGFSPLSSNAAIGPGFNDLSANNWIWGLYYTYETTPGLYTLAGFLGSYCFGYAAAGEFKLINSNLFNQISDSDPRKLWWISPSGNSNAQYYTAADGNAVEYLQGNGVPTYAVTKFAPYDNVLGQSVNESDVPIIRIEEMYYILAEAKGLGSSIAEGVQVLENFVNSYRWLNKTSPYTCQATTPEDFIDEIFFQRSVEFWGEGMTYYDIMRLGKPIDRRNSNWTSAANNTASFAYYIEPTNPVLISPIPTSEIDNNKQISESDQNPTGSAI